MHTLPLERQYIRVRGTAMCQAGEGEGESLLHTASWDGSASLVSKALRRSLKWNGCETIITHTQTRCLTAKPSNCPRELTEYFIEDVMEAEFEFFPLPLFFRTFLMNSLSHVETSRCCVGAGMSLVGQDCVGSGIKDEWKR